MSEIDEIRQSLRKLGRRLAEGEIDEATYDRLRDKLLAELTPAERVESGLTPAPATPWPVATPSPFSPVPLGPSGSGGRGVATRIASLSALDLRPGAVLFNKWRVERELGRGGFGVVVEAEELRLGRRQAVKVLDPAMVARPELLERFRREVNRTRDLVHPRVVRVYDYDEDLGEGVALFSMELVRGCSVQSLLAEAREKGEAVPVSLALTILVQVLEALEAAHAKGVIHRDVTPANILLAGGSAKDLLADAACDPLVKLVDFGIAGALERSELSQKSRVLGTAAYVAPEVLDARFEITPAVDVYGLGAVFYELLTGRAPLGRFQDPSMIRTGLAPRIDRLALSLLEAEPAARPRVPDAMAAAREALPGEATSRREGPPGHPAASSAPPSPLQTPELPHTLPAAERDRFAPRWALLLAGTAVAVGVLAGILWIARRPSAGSTVPADATLVQPQPTLARAVSDSTPVPASPVIPVSVPSPEPAESATPALDGRWRVIIEVTHTTYKPFLGLTADYDLTISQDGSRISARGFKVAESGRPIPERSQDAIEIEGHLENDRVKATYVLHGSRRESTGGFEWAVSQGGNRLDGTFFADRSEVRGSSSGTRNR